MEYKGNQGCFAQMGIFAWVKSSQMNRISFGKVFWLGQEIFQHTYGKDIVLRYGIFMDKSEHGPR